mgnify:CR=1 FL=1
MKFYIKIFNDLNKMDTRSYTQNSSKKEFNFRYQPYYKLTNKRSSFTNSHFKIWKKRIDKYVYDTIKYHLDDLPDLSYMQWFKEGHLQPRQVSYIVLGEYYKIYNLNQLYFNN